MHGAVTFWVWKYRFSRECSPSESTRAFTRVVMRGGSSGKSSVVTLGGMPQVRAQGDTADSADSAVWSRVRAEGDKMAIARAGRRAREVGGLVLSLYM
jgi:hypothetical protein